MQLQEYAYKLLKLNERKLAPYANSHWYASIAFGLVEELLEFHERKTEYELGIVNLDAVVKEAGDVLAYAVLIAAAHSSVWGCGNTKVLELSKDVSLLFDSCFGTSYDSVLTAAFTNSGLFKRWFREHKSYPPCAAAFCVSTVFADLSPHSITLAEVAQTNIDKLRDRAQRNQLFQGSGSNR